MTQSLEQVSIKWNQRFLNVVVPAKAGTEGPQIRRLPLGPRFRGDDEERTVLSERDGL
jgi:hypothetical protein